MALRLASVLHKRFAEKHMGAVGEFFRISGLRQGEERCSALCCLAHIRHREPPLVIFAKCAEQVCAGLTYVTVTVENGEYLFESHYGFAQVGLDPWGLGSESGCHT